MQICCLGQVWTKTGWICRSSETFGQWSGQWASLVNSCLSQWSVPYETRWHRSGTTLRNLKRRFRAAQHWMLGNHSTDLLEVGHQREHRDERYFWIQEQVQDEDFSVRKEKNCANVGKKPIVASVLQKSRGWIWLQPWYARADPIWT